MRNQLRVTAGLPSFAETVQHPALYRVTPAALLASAALAALILPAAATDYTDADTGLANAPCVSGVCTFYDDDTLTSADGTTAMKADGANNRIVVGHKDDGTGFVLDARLNLNTTGILATNGGVIEFGGAGVKFNIHASGIPNGYEGIRVDNGARISFTGTHNEIVFDMDGYDAKGVIATGTGSLLEIGNAVMTIRGGYYPNGLSAVNGGTIIISKSVIDMSSEQNSSIDPGAHVPEVLAVLAENGEVVITGSSITSSDTAIAGYGASTVTVTDSHIVAGSQAFYMASSGTLNLTADNSTFKGIAAIYPYGDGSASIINLTLAKGSSWEIPGDSKLTNLTLTDSTVVFSAPAADTFTTLTVTGNFVGNNGVFQLNTRLDGDNSPTDLVHIKGNTSGTAVLRVKNAGGNGALTSGDGIKVVDVDGTSDAAFSLSGDYLAETGEEVVVAGAYGYTLHRGGLAKADDGDWYLRSQIAPPPAKDGNNGGSGGSGGGNSGNSGGKRYQPFVPTAEGYVGALSDAVMAMESFRQRVGGRYGIFSGDTTGSVIPPSLSPRVTTYDGE
ncbi:MAG: autotransporter outer membrane beta-barrel domain-containing protein, partial [Methylobacteriaceae bacterium]|nr:autotransporter outer membrane beta-barrel domain-containing protein [Methylobacteriaceae bacterium]